MTNLFFVDLVSQESRSGSNETDKHETIESPPNPDLPPQNQPEGGCAEGAKSGIRTTFHLIITRAYIEYQREKRMSNAVPILHVDIEHVCGE